MINKKALYTFAILASVLCTKIDAAAALPGETTSEASETAALSDKIIIQGKAKELLKGKTTAAARTTADSEWEALALLSFLDEEEAPSDERRDVLVKEIVTEIKRQLASR